MGSQDSGMSLSLLMHSDTQLGWIRISKHSLQVLLNNPFIRPSGPETRVPKLLSAVQVTVRMCSSLWEWTRIDGLMMLYYN